MASLSSDLAGDLYNTYLSMKFELLRHVSRRRLPIALLLATLLPMIFYIIPPLFDIDLPDTAKAFASENLGFMSLLIIISAILFAGDAISGEFEKRTGLLLFPTAQRTTTIYTGKYLAGVLSLFAVVSVYYLVTILEICNTYGLSEIPDGMLKSYLLALIYSTSVLSVVFFLSSILSRGILSSLIGFFLMMMIMPMIRAVLIMVEVDPWFILVHSYQLVTNVLGVAADVMGPGGGQSYDPEFYEGTAVMAGYTMVLYVLSLFIANRRKME